MNPIDCLVKVAYEANTIGKVKCYVKKQEDGAYVFVNKRESSFSDLLILINDCRLNDDNKEHGKSNRIINAALIAIKNRMKEKDSSIGIISRIFMFIFGETDNYSNFKKKLFEINSATVNINYNVKVANSEQEAQCRFYGEFSATFDPTSYFFKTIPNTRNINDLAITSIMSNKIWTSGNVQQSKHKYLEYKKLMTEFYVGSHILIEEQDGASILKDILDNPNNNYVEERNSSHYGLPGTEMHHHIRGSQLPETLFHEGTFAAKLDASGNLEHVKPNRYWSRLKKKPEKLKKLTDQGYVEKRFFWIQTERTPDGPNIFDYLYHRTVDFVQYFFFKNIFRMARPQIAAYIGPEGRGLSDKAPIVLRLNPRS